MQTTHKSLVSDVARLLLGLAAILAISSQSQAEQYGYYASSGSYQPGYHYVQPAYGDQSTAGYATQYYQTWYATQYYQYSYTPQYYQTSDAGQSYQTAYSPQYYQAAEATQTTAGGAQVIPATYTVPVADATASQPVQAAPAASYGGSDPYGFLSWLNAIRASYGLGPVGHDQNLSNWAAMNNSQQMAQGLGHFVMGPARHQNSAAGAGFPGVMWMASPAHSAALLDPTISWIGIAAAGAYWTFNAY